MPIARLDWASTIQSVQGAEIRNHGTTRVRSSCGHPAPTATRRRRPPGSGRAPWPRPGTSAGCSSRRIARCLPDPHDPGRILLRRRPGCRPDPGHPAGHGPGRALRRFHDRGGLVLGICNGFQVLVRAGLLPGRLDGPSRDARTQRLGPLRGPLGPAGDSTGSLARSSRPIARADRASRGPWRGPVRPGHPARPRGSSSRPARSSCNTPTATASRPRIIPITRTARPRPWPASATRPAGSSA